MIDIQHKKVLFISYLFPPVAGGGVQRSSKFVKYLPAFGWMPLVLTVKEPYDFYSDESLLLDVKENSKIYRTLSIEPMKWVRKFLKKRWQKKIDTKSEKKTVPKSLKPGFLVKLKTYLLFPDNEILWLPFAVWRGSIIIIKERPAIIYSTASPFTDHLIALVLSLIFKLPWVADFRDLWVDRPNFPKNKWRLFIDRKLERIVIKNADHIITATSLMADRFNKLYPGKKYTSITNGFDEDDFTGISESEPPEDKFTITYTGIFNKEQNPQKIFLALKKLIDERPEIRNKIKIKFVGQMDNPGDFENINLFNELGLDEYSELVPHLPHKKVIAEMYKSSVLLLLVGEYPHNEGILTGKIFEYLRSGKPIAAVVPVNGLAADVIRKTNSGIVLPNDNPDEIANCFSKLFDLFIKGELNKLFKRINIQNYSRKNLTKELSLMFEQIISQRNEKRF